MSVAYNITYDHHHYPIVTHPCFYFAKFGPDNAMVTCWRFWDHLLKKCHIMSRSFGRRGKHRTCQNHHVWPQKVTLSMPTPPQQQLPVVLPQNLVYTACYVSKWGRNFYKSIVSQDSLTETIWCGNHLLKPLFRSTIGVWSYIKTM